MDDNVTGRTDAELDAAMATFLNRPGPVLDEESKIWGLLHSYVSGLDWSSWNLVEGYVDEGGNFVIKFLRNEEHRVPLAVKQHFENNNRSVYTCHTQGAPCNISARLRRIIEVPLDAWPRRITHSGRTRRV